MRVVTSIGQIIADRSTLLIIQLAFKIASYYEEEHGTADVMYNLGVDNDLSQQLEHTYNTQDLVNKYQNETYTQWLAFRFRVAVLCHADYSAYYEELLRLGIDYDFQEDDFVDRDTRKEVSIW